MEYLCFSPGSYFGEAACLLMRMNVLVMRGCSICRKSYTPRKVSPEPHSGQFQLHALPGNETNGLDDDNG